MDKVVGEVTDYNIRKLRGLFGATCSLFRRRGHDLGSISGYVGYVS